MTARRTVGIVVATIGILVGAPTAASADQPCLVVACDVELDVDPLPQPDEVVEDPVGTVTDVVDGAEGSVGPVVDPLVDLIDDLLGGEPVDPPGGGPDDRGSVVEGREGERRGPSTDLTPTGFDAGGREGVRPDTVIGSAATGTRPLAGPTRSQGVPRDVIDAAVRGLLLLAVLFGLAVGFVVMQSRLDRRDPRLAAASPQAEMVTFG